MDAFRAFPDGPHRVVGERQFGDRAAAADDLRRQNAVRHLPKQGAHRALATASAVHDVVAVGRHRKQVAAMVSLIAHQAFDERDRLAVGRPARDRHLQRRFVNGCRVALRDVDRVNLRDPPVVVSGAWSRGGDERLVVRRPIVIVNVQVRRRNLPELTGGNVENRDPLIMNRGVDDARRNGRGYQRPAARRAFNIEKRDLFSVVRPTRTRRVAGEVS